MPAVMMRHAAVLCHHAVHANLRVAPGTPSHPTWARTLRTLARVAAGFLCVWGTALQASPFTYQGRLVDGGTLANGAYEITFRLFDGPTGNNSLGASVIKSPVAVQNGIFSLELDFGNQVFTGAELWLELSARPVGNADPPETLSPRQAIRAVPYAIRAFSGSGNASELTTGTVPDARLSPSIARSTDLLSTSNSLASLWAELSARLETLNDSLVAISNAAQSTIPSGVNVASTDPADAGLIGQGFVRFVTIPATGWTTGAGSGPSPRVAHSSVWSGESLYVWGGMTSGGIPSSRGYRYAPDLDRWFELSQIDSPTARSGHSGVWTPLGMILWGGFGGGFLASGALLSTQTGNWIPLPLPASFEGRDEHVSVWTGSRMVIWGGRNASGLLQDGASYDPVAKQWSPLPSDNAPEARQDAVGVWTGTQLILWGGLGTSGELATGGRLAFTAGAVPGNWSATEPTGAPSARSGHTMVWTGSRVLVWGGQSGSTLRGDGAAFDPAANAWQPLPALGAPTARAGHLATWAGDEMLIYGGRDASGDLSNGAAYRPSTGKWRPLPGAGSPVARRDSTGAWTGSDWLLFGGRQDNSPIAALQRLNPQPTWHFYRKP